MSISSTDHIVMPENEGTEDVETAVEATTEAAPEVTFASLGLPDGIVRKLAQNGVTAPFPIQAATIPDALAKQGHPRPWPHRLRQDPLVRPAAARDAVRRPHREEAPARHHPHPDPRAGDAGRRRPPALRRRPRPEDEGRLRRHVHGQPDLRPRARRRRPRRHPGPPARHHQPRRLLPRGRAHRRPRRGRPDVRPGLPARGHRAARPDPGRRPAHAVLGDDGERDLHPRQAVPHRRGHPRGRQRAGQRHDDVPPHPHREAQGQGAGHRRDRLPQGPHDHLRPHPAGRRPHRRAAARVRCEGRRAARRHDAGRPHPDARGLQGGLRQRARRDRRGRPRYPRRRHRPGPERGPGKATTRTTCTVRAAPRVPVVRAPSSPSPCRTSGARSSG